MDFKQLQSLITVARYESFTKAATRLGVSQPTVSTHIRMLEEELGVPLVLRTSKRVELTPKGRKVFDQAVSILSMRDRMVEEGTAREKNTVYLGASSVPSAYVLPSILSGYSKSHPNVSFSIYQGDSRDVVSGLTEGVYDVGLIGMPADEESLLCTSFTQDRLVLVTPATDEYRMDEPDAAGVRDLLLGRNVLLRHEGSASRSVVDRILDDLGIEESRMHVGARINDQETIKNLVESGLGVTIVSERAVRDRVREGRLLSYDIPSAACKRSLYIAHRKGDLGEEVAGFVSYVRLSFARE